jgi:hypothetical protein
MTNVDDEAFRNVAAESMAQGFLLEILLRTCNRGARPSRGICHFRSYCGATYRSLGWAS